MHQLFSDELPDEDSKHLRNRMHASVPAWRLGVASFSPIEDFGTRICSGKTAPAAAKTAACGNPESIEELGYVDFPDMLISETFSK